MPAPADSGPVTTRGIRAAEVVLPCADLDPTLAFFVDRLGFRVATIFPADDPAVAVIVGHGLSLRLERGFPGAPGTLRLLCPDPIAFAGGALTLQAPNGTRVEIAPFEEPLVLPPLQPSFVRTSLVSEAGWKAGRAGMAYRDLIPGRQGGRFIASHIRIPEGGPVPDYVHFHKVRFQMIYCYRGWVRVVYEDQGPPFVLQAGDCVLQPPQIRHRVLECSPGLEVVEIGCPAEHETHADLELELPTAAVRPERDFHGQRFVRHEAARATQRPWRTPGFEARDLGMAEATGGVATAQVARRRGPLEPPRTTSHDAELLFMFVLEGTATLHAQGREALPLRGGDSLVIPAGLPHALAEGSDHLQILEVALPAGFETVGHEGRAFPDGR